VINLPTISSGYSELYCRSGARAERAENRVERSAEREVAEREQSGELGIQK